MQAFFAEVAEAEIPAQDVMRKKSDIIRIWVDLTWQEAQKNNPTWKEKSYWKNRKDATLKTWDKWYTDFAKAQKQEEPKKQKAVANVSASVSQPPKLRVVQSSQVEEEYYSQFELFTTHEQVKEHTRQYEEKIKKELAQ